MVLGCSPFEQRHTGELMAGFVEDICESWGIRSKVNIKCDVFPSPYSEGGWTLHRHGQQYDQHDDPLQRPALEWLPQPYYTTGCQCKF